MHAERHTAYLKYVESRSLFWLQARKAFGYNL